MLVICGCFYLYTVHDFMESLFRKILVRDHYNLEIIIIEHVTPLVIITTTLLAPYLQLILRSGTSRHWNELQRLDSMSGCQDSSPSNGCWATCPIVNPLMTSSNGNIFRVTGPLCGEFTGPGEFPAQRPVTQSFGVYFDLRLDKRLSKQPWGWWLETPS